MGLNKQKLPRFFIDPSDPNNWGVITKTQIVYRRFSLHNYKMVKKTITKKGNYQEYHDHAMILSNSYNYKSVDRDEFLLSIIN